MTEKKEIKLKKSLLILILKSIGLSILTLFIIQHFGEISTDHFATNPKIYFFENPINGLVKNSSKRMFEYPTYLEKVIQFYIPSTLNVVHIFFGSLFFGILFAFFGNYKLKLT